MPSDRGRDAVEPEEAPPAPLTAPGDLPAGGKSAEDILASIFSPVPETSPLEQLEQTLRHPKKLIYIAMSNRNFYCRGADAPEAVAEDDAATQTRVLVDLLLLDAV